MHPDYVQLFQCKQRIHLFAEEMKPRQAFFFLVFSCQALTFYFFRIDDADNVDQVLMIHQALVGAPFGVKAQRRLVLQSSMSLSGEERIYILFSDILVFVRPKQEANRTLLQFKGMVALERARLTPVEPSAIEITSPFQGIDAVNTTILGSAQVHVLQAESAEDRDRWMEQLRTVVANLDRASAKCKSIVGGHGYGCTNYINHFITQPLIKEGSDHAARIAGRHRLPSVEALHPPKKKAPSHPVRSFLYIYFCTQTRCGASGRRSDMPCPSTTSKK